MIESGSDTDATPDRDLSAARRTRFTRAYALIPAIKFIALILAIGYAAWALFGAAAPG